MTNRIVNSSPASSSVVASLLFRKDERLGYRAETRNGSYIYGGSPANFHEWVFRTRMQVQGRTDQQYLTAMTNVIQGLKGDAVLVAQEIGLDKLNAEGDSLVNSGLELLIREMKAAVFPQTQNEAKDLFKVFMKAGGPLSRQLGESMQQTIYK